MREFRFKNMSNYSEERSRNYETKKVYVAVIEALGYQDFINNKMPKDEIRCELENALQSEYRFFIQDLLEDEDYEFGKEDLMLMWSSFIQCIVRPKTDLSISSYFGRSMYSPNDVREITNQELERHIEEKGVTSNIFKTKYTNW